MKILMLVNWKIEYCKEKPADKQPPDYKVEGERTTGFTDTLKISQRLM